MNEARRRPVDLTDTHSIADYLMESLEGTQPLFAVRGSIGNAVIIAREGREYAVTVNVLDAAAFSLGFNLAVKNERTGRHASADDIKKNAEAFTGNGNSRV